MEPIGPVNRDLMKKLEEALEKVRGILAEIESPDGSPVDYQAWSEAKGSQFGNLFEATRLDNAFVDKCQVVASRYDLLSILPKNGCVAEIGSQYGQFAGHIARTIIPRQLHLYDLHFRNYDSSLTEVDGVDVILHEGDSSQLLSDENIHFDWAYLDADHSYEGVRKDLHALKDKINPGGFIICNDYIPWSPLEACVYGIPRAVHEFCRAEGWGFRYLALHPWGYHDVALQRLKEIA